MRDDFYIQEAFSRLKLLDEEAFDLSKDVGVADELTSFVADDIDYEEEPIIDTEASNESELQDSYVGKVILECDCCHTRLYKNEDEVVIDEETGLANADEPCPVCNGEFGYSVIGKIEPFDAEADPEKADEPVEVDLDDEEDEIDDEVKEAFNEYSKSRKGLKEAFADDDVCPECGKNPCVCEKCGDDSEDDSLDEEMLEHGNDQIGVRPDTSVDDDKSLEDDQTDLYKAAFEKRDAISESKDHLMESINTLKNKVMSLREALDDVVVNTDEGSVEVSKEGEKVIVDFSGGASEPEVDPLAGEMIAPLGDEDVADIEANVPEDEMGDEIPMDDMGDLGGEEEPSDEEDLGIEDLGGEEEEELPLESLKSTNDKVILEGFDNAGFEKMVDVFMHRVYENVNNYSIDRVGQDDSTGNVIVEGMINFNSGKSAPTTFTFNSISTTKLGKTILEGINTTFSKSKAFKLRGSMMGKEYVPESFTYNYNTRIINESNEAEVVKVKGRVKR